MWDVWVHPLAWQSKHGTGSDLELMTMIPAKKQVFNGRQQDRVKK
jgi:hypothetical protein